MNEKVIYIICYRVKIRADDLNPNIQLSLERLSQFVQVALHTNSIYGSKRKCQLFSKFYSLCQLFVPLFICSFIVSAELITRLQTLPKIRLLKIILSRHKEIV